MQNSLTTLKYLLDQYACSLGNRVLPFPGITYIHCHFYDVYSIWGVLTFSKHLFQATLLFRTKIIYGRNSGEKERMRALVLLLYLLTNVISTILRLVILIQSCARTLYFCRLPTTNSSTEPPHFDQLFLKSFFSVYGREIQ